MSSLTPTLICLLRQRSHLITQMGPEPIAFLNLPETCICLCVWFLVTMRSTDIHLSTMMSPLKRGLGECNEAKWPENETFELWSKKPPCLSTLSFQIFVLEWKIWITPLNISLAELMVLLECKPRWRVPISDSQSQNDCKCLRTEAGTVLLNASQPSQIGLCSSWRLMLFYFYFFRKKERNMKKRKERKKAGMWHFYRILNVIGIYKNQAQWHIHVWVGEGWWWLHSVQKIMYLQQPRGRKQWGGKLKIVVFGFSGLEFLTHKLAVIPGCLKQEWAPSERCRVAGSWPTTYFGLL